MNKQIINRSWNDPSLFENGGPYEPLAKNYPACKMLFVASDMPRVGDEGGFQWIDRINGIILNSLSPLFPFAYNDFGVSGAIGTMVGDLPILGDTHLLFVSTGRQGLANNKITLGDPDTSSGILLRGNSNGVTRTAGDWGTIGGLVNGYPIDGSICIYIDRANDEAVKLATHDTAEQERIAVAPGGGTFDGPWSAFNDNNLELYPTVTSGSKLIALFGFQDAPPHPELAMQFMAAHPDKLPPWWAGVL